MGPALRPGLGFRPEYFFSGGSIDNNHIAVEKQASASDRRSHNFVGAVLVLNLVSILLRKLSAIALTDGRRKREK